MIRELCFLVLFSVSLIYATFAQDRAPHGLAYQNPVAFSPTAYDFFHPNGRNQDPCVSSKCSPFPLAAQVHEAQAQSTAATAPRTHSGGIGAGAAVATIFAAIVIVCLAMGIYYVTKTRKANVNRNKTVQSHV
ncbi:uncharacterized protein LOC130805995 [Amaranthus tricolor]|uniref:uncharacterized protein LOC130805995 n=1 Tax=Amaranthus tricolor TaxID=29722 RepID=UPI0025854B6B|nr:uncharacterized protein LOC130805995 [Amaranthus tricolor]